ncbi:MAG: NBR1-Ig-like domain-containing protein [Chloroflexota bacterium]
MFRTIWARLAPWIALAALTAGCNFPSAGHSSEGDSATMAAGTVAAVLTQVGERPTITVPTMPATTAAVSPTTPSGASATLSTACLDRATLIDDVTIRDNTPLAVGEMFVKIWRLQNSGTCTWTTAYALVFFGGDHMQAPDSVPLAGTVPPGSIIDLAVDMTAPSAPGTYQGFWRLRNAAGSLFGLGAAGDQSFWVKIVVRPPLTPTVSPAPSATASPTPAVLASSALDLALGEALDLDRGALNPTDGADLSFGELSPSGTGLMPEGGALLALYSPPPDPPRPLDCLAAPLHSDPVPASLLGPGSVVCYLTGQSHPGYLVVVSLDDTLSLAFTTWVP